MFTLSIFVAGSVALWFTFLRKEKTPLAPQNLSFLTHEKLEAEIDFYRRLPASEKTVFIGELKIFLQHTRIIGVGTEVTDHDRMLVAASGVIPIFYFPDWHSYDLDEVLLYPGPINLNFETGQPDSNILGLVGTGQMEGKMALCRNALREGFSNKTDKSNTAIHEFVHLVDKADGTIDGLPKALIDKPYAIPWLKLVRHHMEQIQLGKSDIDEYGATRLGEFFPVAAEYFFERPDLLRVKHPDVYAALDQMFKRRLTS